MWYQYSYIHNIDSIACSFFIMWNRIRWKSNKLIESRASGRKPLIIYTFILWLFASSKIKDIGNHLSALWLPFSVEKYFCQTVIYNCNLYSLPRNCYHKISDNVTRFIYISIYIKQTYQYQ